MRNIALERLSWPTAWRASVVAGLFVFLLHSVSEAPTLSLSVAAPPRGEPDTPMPLSPAQNPPRAYPLIAQKPLFHPDRHPWTAPASSAAADPVLGPDSPQQSAVPAPRNYTLVGIVLTDGVHRAILSGDGHLLTLSEGQHFDRWTVKTISADRIDLIAGDAHFEITFPKHF